MVINGIRKSKAGQEAGERWGACHECSGVLTAPLSDRGLSASKFYINYNHGGGGSELGAAFLGGWDWQCPESWLTGVWGAAPRSTTPDFPLEHSPGGTRTGMTTEGKMVLCPATTIRALILSLLKLRRKAGACTPCVLWAARAE